MIKANLQRDQRDPTLEMRHPQITHSWIRTAIRAGRQAFEREMRRDRKSLDAEFDRFWKEQDAR